MRVTKLIREYVEKSVRANYPKSVAELVWEEHRKSMSDAITEANEQVFENFFNFQMQKLHNLLNLVRASVRDRL